MSSFICCFLTCIQISQEAGQVVWYSHLFQNFSQFVVIHTVKGFGIVNKAEIDVFLELSCFFDDPADVDSLVSGSSAFSNPAWTSGRSRFMYRRLHLGICCCCFCPKLLSSSQSSRKTKDNGAPSGSQITALAGYCVLCFMKFSLISTCIRWCLLSPFWAQCHVG